ncbi:hypothetical protein BU17DRAFT_90633 [Hysterangium stoloniferum]|nr:hypothetical protein BU17DRAFT_90633 [Hysterangium stoloniferum]
MQLSLIALFAGAAMAAPMTLHNVRSCEVTQCIVALGPVAVGCGSAVVQGGADPVSDIGCVASVLSTVTDIPAPCAGCPGASEISGAVNDAEDAVNGAIDSAGDAVSGAFDDATSAIGSLF